MATDDNKGQTTQDNTPDEEQERDFSEWLQDNLDTAQGKILEEIIEGTRDWIDDIIDCDRFEDEEESGEQDRRRSLPEEQHKQKEEDQDRGR